MCVVLLPAVSACFSNPLSISLWVSIFVPLCVSIDSLCSLPVWCPFPLSNVWLFVLWCWRRNSKPHTSSITEPYSQDFFFYFNKFLRMTDPLVINNFQSLQWWVSLYFVHIFPSHFTHFNGEMGPTANMIVHTISNFVSCVPHASLLQISVTNYTASVSILDNAYLYTAVLGTCYNHSPLNLPHPLLHILQIDLSKKA